MYISLHILLMFGKHTLCSKISEPRQYVVIKLLYERKYCSLHAVAANWKRFVVNEI